VLRLAGARAGAAALDLCCGPGRHALELARRGLAVTGVDRTARYLEEARRRAAAEGLSLELVRADMRSFVRPAAFDLAVSLFTSFSYFEDPAEDLQVARNLRESLRPGGALVMELMGKEVLARIFAPRDWHALPGGGFLLEERRLSRGWSWMQARWILIEGGEVHEREVTHRLYAASELATLLHEAGFAGVELFGDLEGAPYDQDAKRLVAVARRGG